MRWYYVVSSTHRQRGPAGQGRELVLFILRGVALATLLGCLHGCWESSRQPRIGTGSWSMEGYGGILCDYDGWNVRYIVLLDRDLMTPQSFRQGSDVCEVVFRDGLRFELGVEDKTSVTINETKYDLSGGRLFLASSGRGSFTVDQVHLKVERTPDDCGPWPDASVERALRESPIVRAWVEDSHCVRSSPEEN